MATKVNNRLNDNKTEKSMEICRCLLKSDVEISFNQTNDVDNRNKKINRNSIQSEALENSWSDTCISKGWMTK